MRDPGSETRNGRAGRPSRSAFRPALIAEAAMCVRRTRVAPRPFPWIQSFPGDDCPPHFRTGSSHPHDRFGLGWLGELLMLGRRAHVMTKTKTRRVPIQVDDADIDEMMTLLLNPRHPYGARMTAEERASSAYDLAHHYALACGQSERWAKEYARRVRTRLLWAGTER